MRNHKVEIGVLLLINNYSEKKGLDLNSIYSKTKGFLSIEDISPGVFWLEKDGYIFAKPEGTIYYITNKGKTYLKAELKKFKEKDYLDFLAILPSEISQGYRIYSVENTLFWGVFGWLTFNFALLLLRLGYIRTALIILPFSLLSIGLSIGFFVRIMSLILYRFFNKLDNFLKRFKIFDWNIWKISNKVLSKIPFRVIFMVIILLGILTLVGYIGWRFIQEFPKDFKIWAYGLGITSLLGLAWWLFKKSVAKPSLTLNSAQEG